MRYSLCSVGILGSVSSQLDIVSGQQGEQKVRLILQGNDVEILTCSSAKGGHWWAFCGQTKRKTNYPNNLWS